MDSFELKGEEEFNKDFKKEFKPLEIIKTDRKDFYTLFSENKTYIYSILFYIAGLLSGSFIYRNCQNEVLNKVLNSSNEEFMQLLLNNLSIYMLVFAVSVLLGVCLVGFPIINAIPYIIGFEAGMKIAYYYINYGVKGIGYSLLMVAPYVCLFLTVVIYSVSMSFDLSKRIYQITVKKSDMSEEFNYKTYLKRYLAYAGLIAIVAVVNTAVCTALNGIISI
ncbi:MAG: stage II sporulation protein M [Eubacterium sp.]|nr:stage II sporulation protein M [Eubacterium sp.]